MLNGYEVIRFHYSAIDEMFHIMAENKTNHRLIEIGIQKPKDEEMTNAIDLYSNCSKLPLALVLKCFDCFKTDTV